MFYLLILEFSYIFIKINTVFFNLVYFLILMNTFIYICLGINLMENCSDSLRLVHSLSYYFSHYSHRAHYYILSLNPIYH